MILTRETLNAMTLSDDQRDLLMILDDDDAENFFDNLLDLITSCSDEFAAFMRENGLYKIDENTIHYDPSKFDLIDDECASIMEEYDGENKGKWEQYNLGGDDDVDYNGSYPSSAIEFLRTI